MNMTPWVGRAETCYFDKVTDHGGGSIYYVRLADGYLVECGCPQRANFVRDAINAALSDSSGVRALK